jgi:L-aspartate oxidase
MWLSRTMRVALITKERLVDSNSFYAQGGLAVSMSKNDSPSLWLNDTMSAGAGLCRKDAVKMIIDNTPKAISQLTDMGIMFDIDEEGRYLLGKEAYHTVRRILHAGGDQTGLVISQTMCNAIKNTTSAVIFEESYAVDILTDSNGEVAGLTAIVDDCDVVFSTANVVVATGGCGQTYFYTSNPQVATGDGIAMAMRAGATLVDMEFVQFHPTICFSIPGQPFLVTEAVRGEGAHLLNSNSERFMPKYHEMAEIAPRDIVSRACFDQMKKTGSEWVYLDTTIFDQGFFSKRFPTVYNKCMKAGFDPTVQPIPVSPGAHYLMGGIESDLECKTSVKGLFACGEACSNGMHGANRLASNSIPEGLVTGVIAAKSVLENQKKPKEPIMPGSTSQTSAAMTRTELRLENWNNVGITRNPDTMKIHMDRIQENLDHTLSHSIGMLELSNMFEISAAITASAIIRKESRGAQDRTDLPSQDENWGKLRVNLKPVIEGSQVRIETGTHDKEKWSWTK